MINVHEAKTNFSKLLEQAHAGEEIILSKAGKPYSRLMPLENSQQARKPGGPLKSIPSTFFEALPESNKQSVAKAWDMHF